MAVIDHLQRESYPHFVSEARIYRKLRRAGFDARDQPP